MICLIFCCLQTHAQFFKHRANISSHKLIATNEKKTRRYVNGDILKIRYYQNGDLAKAKGRLLIDSTGVVEIVPYGRKPMVIIPVDSIYSISRWYRKGKITLAALAGVSAAFVGLSVIATPEVAGIPDDYSFFLLGLAIAGGYALAIATPIVFISEWASLRSQKRGYHFHVE